MFSGARRAQWTGPQTQNPEVPGSIPGSRRSLLGHFLVMSGSLFRDLWDMLGYVWEYSGDVFGWVWDGFEKKFRGGRKNRFFQKCLGVFFMSRAAQNNYFGVVPGQKM